MKLQRFTLHLAPRVLTAALLAAPSSIWADATHTAAVVTAAEAFKTGSGLTRAYA